MDLETIAEAVYSRLTENGYNVGSPWVGDDDDEYRLYFTTGDNNLKCWLSITEDGIRLLAHSRHFDRQAATALRFEYLNTLRTAKRVAIRVAAGEED